MFTLLFGLLCTGLALAALSLLKTYQQVPAKELKRLARQGDQVASVFYKPVAYGTNLQVLLWLIVGLALAVNVVLLAQNLSGWFAVLLVAIILWIGFVWIPGGRLTKPSIWLARQAAFPLAWVLERTHPVVTRLVGFVRKHRTITIHTGLYEKTDIIELLENQKAQADSRITTGEIDLLQHALSFGDKLVADVLIPKRVVVSVNVDEAIGPILMEELHKSGHSRFPVFEGKKDNLVGILYLRDLITTKKSGKVRDLMKSMN